MILHCPRFGCCYARSQEITKSFGFGGFSPAAAQDLCLGCAEALRLSQAVALCFCRVSFAEALVTHRRGTDRDAFPERRKVDGQVHMTDERTKPQSLGKLQPDKQGAEKKGAMACRV